MTLTSQPLDGHSLQEYAALSKEESCHPDVWCNLACCYFMLGMYPEADATIQKGMARDLYDRLMTVSPLL